MKIAILIARILLGLMFFVFGANHIVPFIHMTAPQGDAATYMSVMIGSGVMKFVGLVQIVGGLLLLVGRFVPLGLTLLGPVIVNILLYDLMVAHGGVAPGLVALVLWLFLVFAYRFSFKGLFDAAPGVS